MQQLRALQRGQERLYEQMRVHQAQHEEQQKRAMLRDAERSSAAAAAAAAAAAPPPQASAPPAMPPTSMPHSSGSPASFPGAGPRGRGDLHSEDGSQHSGSRSTPGAVRARGAAMASTSEQTSGGKMPRRMPSEPHSLAALGVAGMGGRHQARHLARDSVRCLVDAMWLTSLRDLFCALTP